MTTNAARIRAHQQNLGRYCRLLASDLTDLERKFLHKQIAQGRLEMEKLKAQANPDTPVAFLAASATVKSSDDQTHG